MEEEVSWQKLMGIDNSEEEKDSLSPVFHKNKWIVLPKSMKEKENISFNVKSENNGITSTPGSSQHLNSIKNKEKSNLDENSKVPQEEIVYHSPVKTRSMKRKLHDHPLSGSLSPRGPLKKKSRTRNRINPKNLLEQNLYLSSLTNDSVAVENSHSSLQIDSTQPCKPNPISHSKRKLIYSSNKLNTQNRTSNIDITDFYKSVIIMEEADKVSSSKVSNTMPLSTVPKEFVTFSTLLKEKDNFNSKSSENPIVSNYCVQEKSSFSLKHYNPIETNIFNDTLNNYQFTEVEESLGYCKSNGNNQDKSIGPISQSANIDCKVETVNRSENDYQTDQTKHSSIKKTQSANQCSFITSRNENAFNDSFNNFHFTEVEEQYHSSKPKKNIFHIASEFTLNADKVKESLTSTKNEYGESVPNVPINPNVTVQEINHNDIIMPTEECFSKPQEKNCYAQSSKEIEKPNEILTPTDMFLSELPSTLKLNGLDNFHSQNATSRLEHNHEDSSFHNTNVTVSKNAILLEKMKSVSPKWQNQQHFPTIENDFNTMKVFTSKSLNDIDFMQLKNDIKNNSESESNDLTESTDGSKSKVEALLQGILDKPSDVPIQRLLSEEFLDANCTVVQFSTASGSIVKASQESLDKGKELLQEVMAEVENNCSPSSVNFNAAYEEKLDQFCENDVLSNEKHENELAFQSLNINHRIMIEEGKETKKIFEHSLHANLEENNASLANNDNLNHEDIIDKEESMKFESTSRIFSGSMGPLKIVPKLELNSLINIPSVSTTSHTMSPASLNQEREVLAESMEIISKRENQSDSCKNIIQDICIKVSPLINEEKPKAFSNSGPEFHFCTAGGNTVPVSKESLQFVRESQNKSDNEEMKDNFSPLKLTYINILNKTSSNSPASSGKFSQGESSVHSDSQESLFPHNNSSFEDLNFSTENFVCKELKKVNNVLCPNENKTPLKTPFKSFKLSSSKRLLSLSTRSKRLSLSDSENTTPKLFSRKTKTSGEQSTFQQELKKAKYEAEAERIMKSPEYELNNQSISSAHKRNVETKSDKSQSKLKPKPLKTKDLLFNTANGVKVNITKQSLRSARKQLKSELEPVIYEKEVDFIIKSPEYDLQNIKPSSLSTAKGKHVAISENSLQKVKLLFNDDFEIVRQSSDVQLIEDEFVLTTATGQGVNVSKESMEKVKNIFQDEIGPLTKDLPSMSKSLNSSVNELNEIEINNRNFRKDNLSEKGSSVVDVSCTPKKVIEKGLSKESLTTSEHANSEYPETKVCIHLNSSEAEPGMDISASATKIDISSKKTKSSDIHTTNKTDNVFNGNNNIENGIKNQIIFVKSPTLEEYCKEMLSNFNHIESSFDKNQVIMDDSYYLIKLEKDLEPNEPVDTFSLEQPYVNKETETKDIVNADILRGKSKISFTPNLHEQKVARIMKTDPKHQPAPICLDGKGNNQISDKSIYKIRNIMDYDFDVTPGCSKNSIPVLELKKTMGSVINDLEKSDTYLSTTGIDLEFSEYNSKNSSFPMFSTAKGKNVMISKTTLQKVRSIFKDDFVEITSFSMNNLSSIELNENIKSKDAESTKKHPEYRKTGILTSVKKNNISISEEDSQKVINSLKDEHDSSFGSLITSSLKVKENLEPENSKESGQSQSAFESNLGQLEFVTGTKLQEVPVHATAKSKVVICDEASKELKIPKDYLNVALKEITPCNEDKENFESKVCFNKQESDKYESGVEAILGESNYDTRTKLLNMFSIPKNSNIMPDEEHNILKDDLEVPFCCSKEISFKFIEPESCSSVRHQKHSTLTDCKDTSQSCNTTFKISNVMFSTAGGSKVNISEESLNKAMCMLMDDIVTVGHLPLEENNQMCIRVDGQSSEFRLEREDKMKSCDGKTGNTIAHVTKKNNAAVMFSTAGGNTVSVSEDSLNKVKGMFKDDIGTLGDFSLEEEDATNTSVDCQSSKLMFKREDNIKSSWDESGKTIPHVTKKNNALSMFSTAGGNTVSISEDSLNKVKGMFEDDIGTFGNFSLEEEAAKNTTVDCQSSKLIIEREDNKKSSDDKSGNTIPHVRKMNHAPVTFSTAGGSKVNISEESLNKIKGIFEDDIGTIGDLSLEEESAKNTAVDCQSSKLMVEREDNKKSSDDKSGNTIPHVRKMNHAPVTFSTAGGSKVNISEESLNKVKDMLKDDIETLGNFALKDAAMSTTVGGQTSELTVARENKMKPWDGKTGNTIPHVTKKNIAAVMFSTAGGNTVSLSEESLNKVKGMFEEDIGTLGDLSSEEAAKNTIVDCHSSKLMFKREANIKSSWDKSDNTIPPVTKLNHAPVTFSTAGGSKVNISEESLTKVKDMLNDNIENLGIVSLEDAAMSITVGGQTSKLTVERDDKMKSCDYKTVNTIPHVMKKNNKSVMFSTSVGNEVNKSEVNLNTVKCMIEDDIGSLGDFSLEEEAARNTIVDCPPFKLMVEREDKMTSCDGKTGNTIPHIRKNNAAVMFSTAGGSKVSISEESLNKVKGIFKDDIGSLGDFSLQEEAARNTIVDCPSFKLMVEREDKMTSCDGKTGNTIPHITKKNNAAVMFSTAGGSKVSISEESLNKVKGIFKDDIETLGDFSLEEAAMSITVGGQTSKLTVEREHKMKSSDDKTGNTIPHVTKKSNAAVMFSTASGNTVSVSEDSLNKVKGMFEDDIGSLGDFSLQEEAARNTIVDCPSFKLMVEREDKMTSCDGKTGNTIPHITKKNNAAVMFSTAGGSKVSISEESLNKVKGIFKDDIETLGDFSLEEAAMSITVGGQTSKLTVEREHKMKSSDDKTGNTIPHVTKKSNAAVMFSTASGNTVSVSEDSLNKVKGMFEDDIGSLGDFSLQEEAARNTIVDCPSFKLMVEREDKMTSCDGKTGNTIPHITKKNNAAVMFSTAGGSKVSISEESLNKVKGIFKDDIETLGDFSLEEAAMSITVGGQTSKLTVEREHKMKSSDDKTGNTIPHVTKKSNAAVMFSTAGGNTISVSEDSLNKVKDMFKDDIETLGNFALKDAAMSITVGDQSSKLTVEREDKKKSCNDKSANTIIDVRKNNNAAVMFSTAGGNTVSVSEVSLNKVKDMFKDDIETLGNFALKDAAMSITVGDQSSKLTVESEDKKKSCNDKSANTIIDVRKNNNAAVMFSTAGGNTVSVSEVSLNKVKDMFKDDIETLGNFTLKDAAMSITVGDQSSKLTVEREDKKKSCNDKSANTIIDVRKNNNAAVMFSTAGGNTVSVSEVSLIKVKDMFKDDIGTLGDFSLEEDAAKSSAADGLFSKPVDKEDKIYVSNENYYNSVSHIMHKNIMPVMFSTAGGGKVNISEESLIKVKCMFKEDIDCLGNGPLVMEADRCILLNNMSEIALGEDHKIVVDNIVPDLSNVESTSISVVGRTNVGVLQQCLQKLEGANNDNLKNQIILGSEAVNNVSFKAENIPTVIGSHSDQDTSMLNKILFNNNKNSDAPEIKKQISKAFSTANQNVPEKGLNSTKIMFKGDSEPCDDTGTGMETMRAIASDTSFINEKIKFTEIQDISEVMNEISAAFCTASGSDIRVSNESLSKVKNLFKDDLKANSSYIKVQPKREESCTFVDDSPSMLPNPDLDNESAILLTSKGHSVNTSEGSLRQVKIKRNDELGSYALEKNSDFESTKCLNHPVTSKDSEALVYKSYVTEESLGIVKSKCQNDTDIECFPNHDSLIFPETPKTNTPLNSQNKNPNASLEQLGFTPTLAGQLLADKLNEIESFICQKKGKEHDSFEKVSFPQDSVSRETPVSYKNESKLRSMNSTKVSQRRLLYKLQEDNEDVGKPYITSPSLCIDRSQVKPIKSFEFDSDDDIFAGAHSQIDKENLDTNNDNSLELENMGPIGEKRIFDCSSAIESVNKKMRLSEDFHTIKMDEILVEREQKREEQRQKINLKIMNPPPVSQGLYKTIREKETLIKFMEDPLNNPNLYSYEKLLEMGLYADVINVTSKNAVEFQFDGHYFFKEECFSKSGYIDLGNGFILILSDSNKVGLIEISNAFLASPNVDPSLVPEGWIKNHYRWIVWKLASLEKSFPEILSRRYLTPLNVLHQLKFRYDREIDLVQRPALRRILECDEPASRRFIARVADLRKLESDELDPSFELEITDGWYGVWSTVDSAMMKLIKKGTVKVGTKLIIQGAELMNCGDGCDPLELKESVRLKLSTNSVRRVKWNTRMGFTRCPGPLRVSLASILPDGGTVGITSAIVARVYPMLYMSKDENGKSVVRNVQAENQIAADFEKERNLKSEKLYEEILSEVENKFKKGPKSKIDTKNLKWIMNPPALYRIISQEPEMHAFMSPEQLNIVKKYHEEITSKIQAEVQTALQEKLKDLAPQRQVTTLLKIRIIDPLTESSAMVTIWRPPEELCSLLTENRCIDFHGLNASGIRNNVLQLTSGKTTCYKESRRFQMPVKFHRKLFDFSQLAGQCPVPLFCELDVVGVVVHVKEPEKPESVANVYLSDLKDNFLMITFWTSLKVFGFKELLKEGSIVTGTNLHWRQGLGSYIVPSVYANELTCFSSHSSQEYISKELSKFKAYFSAEDMKNFIGARKSALFSLLKDRGSSSTPVRRVDSIGVSPHIAKRLEKLKSYGPAPPLPKTPLLSSPDIRKGFKPPKINKTSLDSPKV